MPGASSRKEVTMPKPAFTHQATDDVDDAFVSEIQVSTFSDGDVRVRIFTSDDDVTHWLPAHQARALARKLLAT
jgi:hypothetical protein